jgi:4-amino-4-deoxy-L-arabinose transferase-like glycosyltransferase
MARRLHAALLVPLCCAPLFLLGLGVAGLNDPDEGRNAEVAREMLAGGDWVTPHLNDARYLDKPPVFFWAVAVSLRIFGVNERAARLPSALAAIATLGLVVWFARRRFGEEAAWLAGPILALSPLYLVFARLVIFDMLLLLFTVAAIIALYETLEGEGPRNLWTVAAFAAAGLGTITKGPVALVVPLLVAVVWAFVRRKPAILGRIRWLAGFIVYLAVIAPWLLLVESRNPGFLRYAVLGENLARMAANPYDTARPFHFYLKVILPGLFPWVVLCAVSGVRALTRRLRGEKTLPWTADPERIAARYVAVWLGVLFLFFSLIASKRPSYILPCAVPVALLAARLVARAAGFGRRGADAEPERGDLAAGAVTVAIVCLVGSAGALVAGPALNRTALSTGRHASVLDHSAIFQITAAGLAAAAALIFLSRRARPALFVAATALPLLCLVPLARVAGRQIEMTRSSRPLSRYLQATLRPEDKVICWEEYRPGLNFYLQRPIYQVTRAGRIFTSNYIAQHADLLRADPGFRLLTQDGLRAALRDEGGRTYVLADHKENGPLFEAAATPLQSVWTEGGFTLFVRSTAAGG